MILPCMVINTSTWRAPKGPFPIPPLTPDPPFHYKFPPVSMGIIHAEFYPNASPNLQSPAGPKLQIENEMKNYKGEWGGGWSSHFLTTSAKDRIRIRSGLLLVTLDCASEFSP